MLLCDKNLETGKFSDKVQHDALQIFKAALDKVINLNNWRRFMIIVGEAAYMDFLRIRRVLMAQIVYKAYKRLCK